MNRDSKELANILLAPYGVRLGEEKPGLEPHAFDGVEPEDVFDANEIILVDGHPHRYDTETGEEVPLDPETAREWFAMRGACPYCGNHHEGECSL